MCGMQATAHFPRPILRFVRVCVRLVAHLFVYLLCYTAPKFPCQFYKDNKIIFLKTTLSYLENTVE